MAESRRVRLAAFPAYDPLHGTIQKKGTSWFECFLAQVDLLFVPSDGGRGRGSE